MIRPRARHSRFPLAASLAMAVVLIAAPSPAAAHSGASLVSVGQEVVLTFGPRGVAVEYITQLNRPGAYLEFLRMDRDGDGKLSPAEQAAYFREIGEVLAAGLEATLNGREAALKPVGQVELSTVPDPAMPETKLVQKLYRFELPHPDGWEQGAVLEFHNDNYLDVPGEILITVDPGEAVDILYDSRWTHRRGGQAFQYLPSGLAVAPPERDVVLRYRRGTGRYDEPKDLAGALDRAEAPHDAAALPRKGLGPAAGGMVAAALLACAAGGAVVTGRGRRRGAFLAVWCLAACLTGVPYAAWAAHWPARTRLPDEIEAGQIFQRLHRGIYRAFEARSEDEIYDTLSRSLAGEVLDEVYAEVYDALRIRGEGSTQFRVRRVKPISTRVWPAEDEPAPAFRVRYRWRVYGTVTHFGHTHARFNEYDALYVVRHDAGQWRIVRSEVRQHKRVRMGAG